MWCTSVSSGDKDAALVNVNGNIASREGNDRARDEAVVTRVS